MLWTLAILFLVLWAVGLLTHVTIGGLIHVLLVLAVVSVLLQVIGGRRAV
jgi:small basic protein